MRIWPLLLGAFVACGGSRSATSPVVDGGSPGSASDAAVDAAATPARRPGEVDRGFGENGTLQIESGSAFAFGRDGRVYVAERRWGDGFDLARYDTNGKRDATFGAGDASHTSIFAPSKLVVADDGSVFAAGPVNPEDPEQIAIVRFDPNGVRDKSFGTDGASVRDVSPKGIFITGLVRRLDGSLLVFGFQESAAPNEGVLYQLTTSGQIDPAFTSPLRPSQIPRAAVGTPANEAYVVASETTAAGTTIDLVRMDAHGSNAGYGQKSVVTAEAYGVIMLINDIELGHDGSLYLFGLGSKGTEVRHLTADGAPDPVFGSAGRVNTPIRESNSFAGAGIVEDDNRVLAAGGSAVNAANQAPPPAIFVARYQPDGTLDPSFGSSGIALETLTTDIVDSVELARTADGRVLVGARPFNSSVAIFALWL